MLSCKQKNDLLKNLNESRVPVDISKKDFINIMGQEIATDIISFPEDELVPEGRGHVRSLHITVDVVLIAPVLIYKGQQLISALLLS